MVNLKDINKKLEICSEDFFLEKFEFAVVCVCDLLFLHV